VGRDFRGLRLFWVGVILALLVLSRSRAATAAEVDKLAGPPPGGVTGKIMNSKGEPLSGVEVTLRRGETSRKLKTDEEGIFCFCRVPPARDYTLVVEMDGFARVVESDVNVAGRKLAVLNLVLRPQGDFFPPPGNGAGGD
jgi:hypothetical protein